MTDKIRSPKNLFTAIREETKTRVYYLDIEVAEMDTYHEQIYFLNPKNGYDCEQLIDLANLLKILHLQL